MHTMVRRAALAVAGGCVLLAGCSSGGSATRIVTLSSASYNTPSEVAQSSEFFLRVVVHEDLGRQPVDEGGALNLSTYRGELTELIARRPDASSKLQVGSSISLGQVLAATERSDIKFSEPFPGKEQALRVEDEYLVFAVGRTDAALGDYLEVVGYAQLQPDGMLVFGGLPGPLAGSTASAESTFAEVSKEFERPAPWRNAEGTEPAPAPSVPDEGRPPVSAGG